MAPALILFSASGLRGWQSFRMGCLAGLAQTLISYYWLLLIPYRWHGIPFGPMAGWLALSAYVALYIGVWVWLFSDSTVLQQVFNGPTGGEDGWSTWPARVLWACWGAAAWAGLEFVRGKLFSGFPWNLIGVSQWELVMLGSVSRYAGVFAVSFVVVWVSLGILLGAICILRFPARRSAWVGEIMVPLLVLAGILQLGFRATQHTAPALRTVKLSLIQPSVPQTIIWDPKASDERIREMIQLSEAALTNHPDVLIWPESAVPSLLRYHPQTLAAVTGLARSNRLWMIIGADDAERKPGAANDKEEEPEFYNASFLINPEGTLVNRYRKQSLVIFGEYVPLEKWLPFMKFFTPIDGGFTPGNEPVIFEAPTLGFETSVLICFEDIFPRLGREAARKEADFLLNLTNNGWFGESAAQWQHAAAAVFRAIENGMPLVRCSNNGLTCWIDSRGRIRELFRDADGSVYGKGILTFDLPLPAQDELPGSTFYNRHGDWFGWGCVALTGLRALSVLSRIMLQRQRGSAV